MNYEIFIAYAIVGVWVACVLFLAFGMTYNLVIFYVREKQEKEREKEEKKEKIKKYKLFEDKVDKKKDFFLKKFSKNYDYMDMGQTLCRGYDEQEKILNLYEAHEAFKNNTDKEFHLITIPSLRNRAGICTTLRFVMKVPKKYNKKRYLKAIEKILYKELKLNLTLLEEIETYSYLKKYLVKAEKSFGYKGWRLNNSDNCLHVVSEFGQVRIFENLVDIYQHGE